MTVDGRWVVWAHKLARLAGDLFVPLTRGPAYPADASAECLARGVRGRHHAPDPGCTCGFHALSSRRLPGLPVCSDLTALTVALSGRVLALERSDEEVLWRAERQTVVRIDQPAGPDRMEEVLGKRRHPDDPDGRLAVLARCYTSRFGANAAEPARLLSGPGDVPRRRRLVCGVQHIRALTGISGPGLARAVPTGGATLPPAGLFAAQIRTIGALIAAAITLPRQNA